MTLIAPVPKSGNDPSHHLKVFGFYSGSRWTYRGGFHHDLGRLVKTGLKGTVKLKLLGGQ